MIGNFFTVDERKKLIGGVKLKVESREEVIG